MSRSAGTGSPVWFRCGGARRNRYHDRQYGVMLTGRTRPYKPPGVLGTRSVFTSYEYVCESCGFTGWSNHIDLARQAGDDDAIRKTGK